MARLPKLHVVLEGHEPILKRLSVAERKAAERAAFTAGGHRWFVDYGPLRFTGYARAKLGWELTSGHMRRKKNYGATEPLVWTGETREAVLSNPRFHVGGSAGKPWIEVRFKLPGPRSEIVYTVLSTILDSEMGGFAENAAEVLAESLGQTSSVGKGSRLTLRGAVSALGGKTARLSRRTEAARDVIAQTAEDRRVQLAESHDGNRAAVARRTKKTHERWRRQSGGSAPTGGVAHSYLRSPRYRHARAQADYRSRYR